MQIRKWYNPADARVADAYYNICLVLDDDEANQLCTDQGKGFADSDDKVTWDLPTENVSKVDLIFRDVADSELSNFFSGQAKVRDLKIFYSDSQTTFGTTTFESPTVEPPTTVPATTPASTTQELVQENDELEWLSIDLSIYNCWNECGGGLCPACMNYESNSTSGYCCSGINHQAGGGPIGNGDCPAEAIAAQLSGTHSCVVSMKKGNLFYSQFHPHPNFTLTLIQPQL